MKLKIICALSIVSFSIPSLAKEITKKSPFEEGLGGPHYWRIWQDKGFNGYSNIKRNTNNNNSFEFWA